MNQALYQRMKIHRQKFNPNQRLLTKKKIHRRKYPYSLENKLASYIAGVYRKKTGPLLSYIKTKQKEYNKNRNQMRTDSVESDLEQRLTLLQQWIASSFNSDKDTKAKLEAIIFSFIDYDIDEIGAILQYYLGTEYQPDESSTNALIPILVTAILLSMQKDIEKFISAVEKLLITFDYSTGDYQKLIDAVSKKYNSLILSGAKNTARNTAGYVLGMIDKQVQQSLGIDIYTWQTAADERVRGRPDGIYPKAVPSHWDMEGVYCKWSDPTVYSVDGDVWYKRSARMPMAMIPGEDWGCRCIAVPDFSRDIKSIDNSL